MESIEKLRAHFQERIGNEYTANALETELADENMTE